MKDITLLIKESRTGKIVIKAFTPLTSKSIIITMIDIDSMELDVKVYDDNKNNGDE